MADDKERLLARLESQIRFLSLALEDEKVRERLKELLAKEIEFQAFLLELKGEKAPPERAETFGARVQRKLKLSWKDWIHKVFEKLNSLLSSIIPGSGGD